ncbi:hypothetical protein MRX96_040201 [Rhipicephalus microplus]
MAEQESKEFQPGSGMEAGIHTIRKPGRKLHLRSTKQAIRGDQTTCHHCGQEHDASAVIGKQGATATNAWVTWLKRAYNITTPTERGKNAHWCRPAEDNEIMLCAAHHAGLVKQPYQVVLMLGRKPVQIQEDPGAAICLVPEDL